MVQRTVHRLTGVYHAEGSLIGELRYVAGKLLGSAHCALCDITHGRVRMKASFAARCAALPVPLETVHLDERTPQVRAFTDGKTPCVVAHLEDGLVMLIDGPGLDACNKDVDRFFEHLQARLTEEELILGPVTPAGT